MRKQRLRLMAVAVVKKPGPCNTVPPPVHRRSTGTPLSWQNGRLTSVATRFAYPTTTKYCIGSQTLRISPAAPSSSASCNNASSHARFSAGVDNVRSQYLIPSPIFILIPFLILLPLLLVIFKSQSILYGGIGNVVYPDGLYSGTVFGRFMYEGPLQIPEPSPGLLWVLAACVWLWRPPRTRLG